MVQKLELYRRYINQLEAFHMHCLLTVCNRKMGDRRRKIKVLTKCNIRGIEAILIKIQLQWAVRLSRKSDSRLLKPFLYGQLLIIRSFGRPFLRFKETQRQSDAMKHPLLFLGTQTVRSNQLAPVLLRICTTIWARPSKAGFAVYSRKHVWNVSTTCSICLKLCKTPAGLGRHMLSTSLFYWSLICRHRREGSLCICECVLVYRR